MCVYGLLKWSLDSPTDTTVCAVLYFPGSVHIYYKYLSLVTLISVGNQQQKMQTMKCFTSVHILGQADREGWTNEGSSYLSFYFHYGELSMHVKIPATLLYQEFYMTTLRFWQAGEEYQVFILTKSSLSQLF